MSPRIRNAPNSSLFPNFNPDLLPYDLTRGGSMFQFHGHTDVKELALYLQDSITKGDWSFNLGMRGDVYNGLTSHDEAEPRVGIACIHRFQQHGFAGFLRENFGNSIQ